MGKGDESNVYLDDSNTETSQYAEALSHRKPGKSVLWHVCIFILVVEACERFCYYVFAGTQKYFLMHLGYPQAQASSMNAAFSILCYFTPLLGGWLADAKLGRYHSIFYLTIVYVVGICFATVAALPQVDNDIIYLIGTMGFVAIGSGGIKPNVANFGGDQYDITDPKQLAEQESFFSYFYMMINVGAGLAYGYFTTLATAGAPPTIPIEWGFFTAYSIATAAMTLALLIFIAGNKRYIKKPPGGDPVRGIIHYLTKGISTGDSRAKFAAIGWMTLFVFLFLGVAQSFISGGTISTIMASVALAVGVILVCLLVMAFRDCSYYVDLEESPLMSLREFREAMEVVPTLVIVNISFNMAYNNMNNTLQSLACQMDCRLGSSQVNGSIFNLGDCIAIIVFVPLCENVVFPIVGKFQGFEVTRNQKLISAMVVGAIAMGSAVALEFMRQAAPIILKEGSTYPGECTSIKDCPNDYLVNTGCYGGNVEAGMHAISAWWSFVPFSLIGLGEILLNPVTMFFVYDQCPPRTRSIMQAFNVMCMQSIPNGFTAPVLTLLSDYLPNDIDDGNVNIFFYIGIATCVCGIPLSLWIMSAFKEKDYTGIDGAISDFDDNSHDGGQTLKARNSRRMSMRE